VVGLKKKGKTPKTGYITQFLEGNSNKKLESFYIPMSLISDNRVV